MLNIWVWRKLYSNKVSLLFKLFKVACIWFILGNRVGGFTQKYLCFSFLILHFIRIWVLNIRIKREFHRVCQIILHFIEKFQFFVVFEQTDVQKWIKYQLVKVTFRSWNYVWRKYHYLATFNWYYCSLRILNQSLQNGVNCLFVSRILDWQ